MIALGLMSGTSLDGIDAALVELVPRDDSYAIELLRFQTLPLERELAEELVVVLPPRRGSVEEVARLHHRLGQAFASAACSVLNGERVDYVASHGQTIFHDGESCVTLQIGDAFVIREAVGATVCYDFRSADCAAGGTGAPLVPFVDALLFGARRENRVAVNIGGIANLTLLPKGGAVASAFDAGPGNMLIDLFIAQRTDGAERFDRDGARAARGTVDEPLLERMLADPYFAAPPPKSTGRERFGAQFLAAHPGVEALGLDDGLATLTELTAAVLARAIEHSGLEHPHVILSGGGAHNRALATRLQARLTDANVERSDVMGVPADAKEAMAFAVLGYETLRERAANVPRVTGARHGVPLGAVAPYELKALLQKVQRELSPA